MSGVSAVLAPAADATTTPLLVDQAGDAAVAVHRFADGHELMLLSFDQAPGAAHSSQLLCGVASWVSRGVFIGEKRAYLTPQPDDLFIGTVMTDGSYFRMSGDDLRNVARWQSQVQATTAGGQLRITFPFVGVGGERQRRSDGSGARGRAAVLLRQPHLRSPPAGRRDVRPDDRRS